MDIFLKSAISFSLVFLIGFCAYPQTKRENLPNRILLVFDASRSMQASYKEQSRMSVAKELLYQLADSLSKLENMDLALRVYGSQAAYPPGDCNDSKLVVPFTKNNSKKIKEYVRQLSPTGITPIAHSLNEAVQDFPEAKGLNMIIIITDGIEECEGDPCDASRNLQRKGIILKPFIVGIGLTPEQAETFNCVGKYFDASEPSSIKNIVNIIITHTLNPTTAQVNLIDDAGFPSETDVAMTFYDNHSDAVRYNFIHTMNQKKLPDTLILDPLSTYRIVTHTIPSVEIDTARQVVGTHNIFATDAGQGILRIQVQNDSKKPAPQCVVRKQGEMNTLNIQNMNSPEKYLTGIYDLEILTLPRTYFNNVEIYQSRVTDIKIPASGTLAIQLPEPGNGNIMVEKEGKLELVVNLSEKSLYQEFFLQPGNYVIVYRPSSRKQSLHTVEKNVLIKSNETSKISF